MPKYGFQTALDARELSEQSNSGRGLWRLTQPLVYTSKLTNDTYVVPVGFKTDFASVPRIPLVWLLVGDIAREAAALHDWLYTAPHHTDRETADAILREAAESTGWGGFQSGMLYYGVRLFGASHWD